MATNAAASTSSASQLLAHNWKWLVLRGVLALLFGVVAFVYPFSAIFAFTLVFAAFAFVDGIFSLVSGVRGATAGERWGSLVFRGILGILVGIIFVLMPLLATVTYAYLTVVMLAAWSIIAGGLEIAAAIRLRKAIEGELLLGLSGAFSLLLGIAILLLIIPNPAATILSAAWLIAIYAIVTGIALQVLGFRLKANPADLAAPVS
jgi:uncharacterized membrane protein HdeD (DUF308 family)